MGRNKEIQKKAREEVLSILGDKPENVLPTKEDLKEMKYLDAVIKEVYMHLNQIRFPYKLNLFEFLDSSFE